jgi:hypothetical protein
MAEFKSSEESENRSDEFQTRLHDARHTLAGIVSDFHDALDRFNLQIQSTTGQVYTAAGAGQIGPADRADLVQQIDALGAHTNLLLIPVNRYLNEALRVPDDANMNDPPESDYRQVLYFDPAAENPDGRLVTLNGPRYEDETVDILWSCQSITSSANLRSAAGAALNPERVRQWDPVRLRGEDGVLSYVGPLIFEDGERARDVIVQWTRRVPMVNIQDIPDREPGSPRGPDVHYRQVLYISDEFPEGRVVTVNGPPLRDGRTEITYRRWTDTSSPNLRNTDGSAVVPANVTRGSLARLRDEDVIVAYAGPLIYEADGTASRDIEVQVTRTVAKNEFRELSGR